MKADLHIHSRYSLDSLSSPKDIVRMVMDRKLDAFAVTDHDTFKGSLAVEKYLKQSGLGKKVDLIKGIEVHSDIGDILCLFVQEPITSKRVGRIIDEVKDQDGKVILAHPYESHDFKESDEFLRRIDGVETFNSRTSVEGNKRATALAKRLNTALIGSSDAHWPENIGNGTTVFKGGSFPSEDLRRAIGDTSTKGKGRYSSKYYWYKSDWVRSYRKPILTRIPISLWGLVKYRLTKGR